MLKTCLTSLVKTVSNQKTIFFLRSAEASFFASHSLEIRWENCWDEKPEQMHSNKFNQKWDQFNKMLGSARICWDLMGSECTSAIFRSFRIQCACVISIKCWDLYAQVPYSDPVTFRCVCVISIKWWDLDAQVQYSDPGTFRCVHVFSIKWWNLNGQLKYSDYWY